MLENMTEEMIASLSTEAAFAIWFLIGAALVFFMQCGFAMVETGFTRAKNAGNIIMKNLMDFCIGTIVFMLLGYTLLVGQRPQVTLSAFPTSDFFPISTRSWRKKLLTLYSTSCSALPQLQ